METNQNVFKEKYAIFSKGLINENPVFILLLGLCPALAVTTSAFNGLGMGVSVIVILTCSNIVISLLRNFIPSKVRIPCYIVVIAGFVTIVQLLLKAYLPELDNALGLFIPLIVVNCVILGRAEMFASKNNVLDATLDGLGMGVGFTIALFLIGAIREIFGAGTFFGFQLIGEAVKPMTIFMLAPGGFFVFAILVAATNVLMKNNDKRRKDFGCQSCYLVDTCSSFREEAADQAKRDKNELTIEKTRKEVKAKEDGIEMEGKK